MMKAGSCTAWEGGQQKTDNPAVDAISNLYIGRGMAKGDDIAALVQAALGGAIDWVSQAVLPDTVRDELADALARALDRPALCWTSA
jgi:hypothetical protein